MPIKDITFHRQGYSQSNKRRLIGGIIGWVPAHPLLHHQLHSVETAQNVTPASHPSHQQPSRQVGHGLSTSSQNMSDVDFGSNTKSGPIPPFIPSSTLIQSLKLYCDHLDQEELATTTPLSPPRHHTPADSDIRRLF